MAIFNQNDLKQAQQDINNAQSTLNQFLSPLTQSQVDKFKADGFVVPAGYSSDGTGLPYSKAPTYQEGKLRRNIITWFIPEFGTVRMYVNPATIRYTFKKIIQKQFTKGGYTLQYWGEELPTLTISGTTGSSGIEGINVLYEIYRAEQYAFDSTGLVIAANNTAANLTTDAFNAIGNAIGNGVGPILFGGTTTGSAGNSVQNAGLIGGVFGLNSVTNSLAATNYTTLAQLAFTVEMYYDGWVYRGYFTDFNFTESAEDFLMRYELNFTVTQRRGYRTNYFPWSKNPANGPSQYDTPLSFSGAVTSGNK